MYKGVRISQEAITVTVARELGSVSDSGYETVEYAAPTNRKITGSVTIYKKDEALQIAAMNVEAETASITVAATMKLNFAGFIFNSSSETISSDNTDATMESKNITADAVVIA